MQTLKKIVVIGPESTGKSTLCKLLAEHYKTAWVPEYARGYLEANGTNYTFEDLLTIAKGQINLEDTICETVSSEKKNPLVFIDTDMYVMKVWCEFVFGKCHQYILQQAATRQYDLYLLCHTDLPWVADKLREYPDYETREKLFLMYQDILMNQHTPWVNITGDYDSRLQKAIAAVDSLLSK